MTELKEIQLDEVSMVDEGANPEAHIVLIKRKENKEMAKTETTEKQEVLTLKTEELPKVEVVDTEKAELQKRVAELEKALAEREAADKAAVEKAAADKLAADNAEITAEFERLNKRFEEYVEKAEKAELLKVASKYEILGENAEQLSATLKKMKAAGVYDEYISKLDQLLVATENSGTFAEIGKVGANSQAVSIEKAADELQKKDPTLSRYWAIEKAYELHPEFKG